MSVSLLGSELSRLTLFALLTRLDMMDEHDACQRRMPVTVLSGVCSGRRSHLSEPRSIRGVERPMKSQEGFYRDKARSCYVIANPC